MPIKYHDSAAKLFSAAELKTLAGFTLEQKWALLGDILEPGVGGTFYKGRADSDERGEDFSELLSGATDAYCDAFRAVQSLIIGDDGGYSESERRADREADHHYGTNVRYSK